MKKRLILSVIGFFLLIAPLAYAQEFDISVRPIKDRVAQSEWAVFDVSIENRGEDIDIYKLSSKVEGTEWSMLTESTFDYATGVTIRPHSIKTVRILLKDKDLAVNPSKAYLVDLSVKSAKTGEKKTEFMQVFILYAKNASYTRDITVSLNMPRYIDPRNIYSFVLDIKNNNRLEIKDLDIKLESSLFTRDAVVELSPNMQKSLEFSVDFAEDQKPLLDTLTVTINEKGFELYRETVPIEIVAYKIPFKQSSAVKKSFLKTVEEITLANEEAVQKQQKVMLELSPLDRLFVSSDPSTITIKKDGKDYLVWDVKLGSGQSTAITVTTNYRPPFYMIMAIIIIIIMYYVFRDPIVIIKHAESIKKEEGGISELKVVLTFKNRSNRQFNRVTVVDKVPHLIEVEKKHDLGTLLPKKIIRTNKGTLLKWELEMDAHEERLIKYLVKTRLSILGRMKLPYAVVFPHDKEGRIGKRGIRSNEVHISED